MTIAFLDVDVRPVLRAGGEPFGDIMEAVAALQPNQGLRLLATFKPTPLFSVLGSKGYTHQERELDGGDWEVLFSPPQGDKAANIKTASTIVTRTPPADDEVWPAPRLALDNRNLDPPEPMVIILAALETMAPGEVLSALLRREPLFLFPELAKRGHQWRGAFEPADSKTYKVLVRIGPAKEVTP